MQLVTDAENANSMNFCKGGRHGDIGMIIQRREYSQIVMRKPLLFLPGPAQDGGTLFDPCARVRGIDHREGSASPQCT
jgi:hypothetical protein